MKVTWWILPDLTRRPSFLDVVREGPLRSLFYPLPHALPPKTDLERRTGHTKSTAGQRLYHTVTHQPSWNTPSPPPPLPLRHRKQTHVHDSALGSKGGDHTTNAKKKEIFKWCFPVYPLTRQFYRTSCKCYTNFHCL